MVSTDMTKHWDQGVPRLAFVVIPIFRELNVMKFCPDQVTFLFIRFNALKYWPNLDLET